MAKRGRPSVYARELGDRFCERLSAGLSIRAVCSDADMPSEATIYRWLANTPEFCENYTRARLIRADARFERVDEVILDMRAGTIDAQQARVEIEAIKWQAGKEAPKKYGERLELAGDKDNPLAVATKVTIEFV